MVSAKDKGKEPMEEEDPGQEKEIKSEGQEETKQGQHPHTGTTIASIGVLARSVRVRRTARMSTGGKTPRHILAPRTLPPHTTRSNHAGKKHSKKEEWRKNNKD